MPLLGAVFGGALTYLGVLALWSLFWGPYWRSLRGAGLYVDDVAVPYLAVFGTAFVALLFFVTSLAILVSMRVLRVRAVGEQRIRLLVYIFSVVPGLVVFVLSNIRFLTERTWNYPLLETIIMLGALAWGISLRRLADQER